MMTDSPYPWQQTQWQQLQSRHKTAQMPHALLLHGPAGIGKADFAQALAQSLLFSQATDTGQACGHCKACQLIQSENHPDFISIQPEEAGKAIKIDQIRALIQQMGLSAHFGGYRVVLINHAEQMNLAASNSLLKTLEEPQPKTVLILVTSQVSRLPATIRSRCQMLRFAMPESDAALSWLTAQTGDQAGMLLKAANGAPLLAKQMAENDSIQQQEQVLDDLLAVASGERQALDVANAWYKNSSADPVRYLYHWLCDLIRWKSAGVSCVSDWDSVERLQSQVETIDLVKLYQFHDQLSEALRLQQTSANGLLILEGILLQWSYLKSQPQRKRA